MVRTRRRIFLLSVVTAGFVVVSGCTAERERRPESVATPPALVITPAAGDKEVPISAEIGTQVTGGQVTAVTMTDDQGGRISGEMRPDGTSWVPAGPLAYKRGYAAEVVATGDSGKTTTRSTKFTTTDRPERRITSTLYFENGRTYGVAMPVTVSFAEEIPREARADVERRLFVSTDPPQPGVWHWNAGGRQVSYRSPQFWQPGTRIAVRAALDGLPIGTVGHGDADRSATARIGGKVTLDIDNRTKQMSVFKDDRLVRRIPVSLGKPSTPTSSGKMVIMEKHESTVFDTRGEPNGGYVVTVSDAMRLTWGGEFIHAAPWSVGDQGSTNVSHGCTNVSSEHAAWLMETTRVGDLVTVTGTEVRLEPGNGWTVWDLDWADYVKGSALPVPPALAPAAPSAPPGAAPVAPSPGAGGGGAPSPAPGG